ncbi:M48 family metalloprotease [Thermosulfuriphilus sp.]
MFTSTILYLLVALVLFASWPAAPPMLSPLWALGIFGAKLFAFGLISNLFLRRARAPSEIIVYQERLSILALIFYGLDVYLLDLKGHLLAMLSLPLPSLLDLAGLGFYLLYLFVLWRKVAHYQGRLDGKLPRRGYVSGQFRLLLPAIVPWVLVNLVADILPHLPWAPLKELSQSPLYELLFFLIFLLIMALFIPVLIRYLWGCRSLPPGPIRELLEAFFYREGFSYQDILLWPIFSGRLFTAGVMGLVGRLRYVLITPGLLSVLDDEELLAVMAHEVGHVKRHHLFYYLFFLLVYGLLGYLLLEPTFYALTYWKPILNYLVAHPTRGEDLLFLGFSIPVVLLLIIYFRYVMGFFMRNFEREADLYAFKALGSPNGLIRALEKISYLAGGIRDLPSWHHYSIRQRVEFLEACYLNPRLADEHRRKLRTAFGIYLLAIALVFTSLKTLPLEKIKSGGRARLLVAMVEKKIKEDPERRPQWYKILASIYLEINDPRAAVETLEEALRMAPEDPEILNNLAWLYLTIEDPARRNPFRALDLALKAAQISPDAYVLDTLALAYFENGQIDEAIRLEKMALKKARKNKDHYRRQLKRFLKAKEKKSFRQKPSS